MLRTSPVVVSDDTGARRLAELLVGPGRVRPVVVVTTPAGRSRSFVDVADIHRQVGDVADVYLVEAGPHTWAFSHGMPEGTQVYGGAGRAYPVGHAWVEDRRLSPVRFAFDVEEGRRATARLVSDVMAMAAQAGLFETDSHSSVTGLVVGIPHVERALVRLEDRSMATVVPELVAPGVRLERLLVRGMAVGGELDPISRRLDLRARIRTPSEALAAYAAGQVVLAQVSTVSAETVQLLLHPDLFVDVPRSAVTSNELDDLRSLMTVGEVLPARLVALEPAWRVSLLDVDDDETPLAAPALLAGGPPWLVPSQVGEPVDLPPPVPGVARAPKPGPTTRAAPQPTPPSPSPLLLARRRSPETPLAAVSPADPGPADTGPAAVVPAEDAAALADLEHQILDLTPERTLLHSRVRELEADHRRHTDEIKRLRTENRRRGQRRQQDVAGPAFADAEEGFRYRVHTAWATRTPVGEQASRPLRDYNLGPEFLDTLHLPGVDAAKVADVVFEVVTDRAVDLTGRDLHQLRSTAAGGSPYVRRERDGATCWRAALQTHAPQARRLHYWMLPTGLIELSRVVLHDDMTP